MGKVSFAIDGSPLGPLEVKMVCEDDETPEDIVSHLTYVAILDDQDKT